MFRPTFSRGLLPLLLLSPIVCAQTPDPAVPIAPAPSAPVTAPVATDDRAAPADMMSVDFPEQAFTGTADVRVLTTADPAVLAGIDMFLDAAPRRLLRDAHAIRILAGQQAPQKPAVVELAVPAALTARSASQDEYLVWTRYPQSADATPSHTFLTADVRYIQSRRLLRFDLEPSAFTRRGDGQWEAILVLTTPDVQPEPAPAEPAATAATATR